MIHEFVYPVILTPDTTDGGFVVTFPDVPEAITRARLCPKGYPKGYRFDVL